MCQVLHWRAAIRREFLGIIVTQLVERKVAAVGHFQRAGDGLRHCGECGDDFADRFQVALGIGVKPTASLEHRGVVAGCGEHIV